jgi:hypothetical protein
MSYTFDVLKVAQPIMDAGIKTKRKIINDFLIEQSFLNSLITPQIPPTSTTSTLSSSFYSISTDTF